MMKKMVDKIYLLHEYWVIPWEGQMAFQVTFYIHILWFFKFHAPFLKTWLRFNLIIIRPLKLQYKKRASPLNPVTASHKFSRGKDTLGINRKFKSWTWLGLRVQISEKPAHHYISYIPWDTSAPTLWTERSDTQNQTYPAVGLHWKVLPIF